MNPVVLVEKRKNALGILNYLIDNGEASRQILSNELKLSSGTVTNIVTELLEKKLILESRQLRSAIGRKSTLLQFNWNLHNIITASIAVDVSDAVRLAVTNLEGEILAEESVQCDLRISETRSEFEVIKNIIDIFRGFFNQQLPDIQNSINAIGICIGGMVHAPQNTDSVQTIDLPLYNWYNVNLISPLSAALQLPVLIEGVTRIKALYEMRFIDPSERNVVFLNLSSGVGMVNFFNGKMVLGKYGIAGEIGHISLNIHGPKCFCGNNGCFEQYCGMNNILNRIPSMLSDKSDILYDMVVQRHLPISPEMLFTAHKDGSLEAHRLLYEVSEYLGMGLATIINIYDPDRIILTGYLRGQDDFIMDRAISYARSRIVKSFDRNITISRSNLKDENHFLPISAFVLKNLLRSFV
ncbi:MAG TPA: ROK family transcriptional regulator [Candidatus Pullichristensenella avicola]|nr:ROK family transcriptional regulator [Candidatus Pullichristensenella avicola]